MAIQESVYDSEEQSTTKVSKSSVSWKLPGEVSFEDGRVPTGSRQSIKKPSSATLRFIPSIQVFEHEDELFKLDETPEDPSFETLRNRRMTAFHSQLEDFKKTEIAKSSVRRFLGRLSSMLCVLSIIIAILVILDLEMSYHCGISFRTDAYVNRTCSFLAVRSPVICKSIISICAIVMCVGLYVHYQYQCRYLIVVHQLPVNATVLNSPLRNSFLAELLLCFIHIPPYMDILLPTEFQLVSLLRLYMTGRYMKEHNATMRSRSTRFLASVLKIELTSSYLVKTFFLKHPLFMIVLCYLLNLFGSGYLVFAMDRYSSPIHHNTFVDTVWMQAVTMTTLGFGDVTPDSILGRAVVALSAVCGIFLMALLISVIHETLQLTQQEKRILAYVERIDYSKRYKEMAARCIQATWRLYRWHKYGQSTLQKLEACLSSMGLVHTKRLLTNQLYSALYYWREIKKSRTPDDLWVKDFVADNTALMLTDVLRKLDIIEEQLLGSSDEKEDDEEESGGEDKNGNALHVFTPKDPTLQNCTIQRKCQVSFTSNTKVSPSYPSYHKVSTAWTYQKHQPEEELSHPIVIVKGSTDSVKSAVTQIGSQAGLGSEGTASTSITTSRILQRIAEAESKIDNMCYAIKNEFSDIKNLIKKSERSNTDDG